MEKAQKCTTVMSPRNKKALLRTILCAGLLGLFVPLLLLAAEWLGVATGWYTVPYGWVWHIAWPTSLLFIGVGDWALTDLLPLYATCIAANSVVYAGVMFG